MRIWDNQLIALDVKASDTMLNVKGKLPFGFAAEDQKISFGGETCEDGRTLSDYNIQPEDTLHLARLRKKL